MEYKESSHFEKINVLYFEYVSLRDKDNIENKLQTIKEKIVIETWKMFYGYWDQGINYQEYAEEMIKGINESLEYYRSQTSGTLDVGFAKYLRASIKRKVRFSATREAVEEKNTMNIPREKTVIIRRIKKENENLLRLGIKNQEKRFAQIRCNLRLSDKDFKELCILALNEKVSLDKPVSNKEDSITLGDFIKAEVRSPEDILENRETLIFILEKIQVTWHKVNDKERILSDALTADILGIMFGYGHSEFSCVNSSEKYENIDVLLHYSFLNQDIIKKFFSDPTYKLPTQEEIGLMHGGMTKGGISKKLSRFYEKLKS